MSPAAWNGVPLPPFIYGTAWKEDATAGLVGQALSAGFRGVDTANQRKHYHEAGVGEGLKASGIPRKDLFLQTKFTSISGQDQRLPYDPSADPATQVRQSFRSSLEHLGVHYLDSFVLHGPSARRGLPPSDWAVWEAIESLYREEKTRLIGASNVSAEQLHLLCTKAAIKPMVVQNRCFAALGWDRDVREICRAHRIVYQGFSLLTANLDVLQLPLFHRIARRVGAGIAPVVFRFAQQVGMVPLTGTSDAEHMKEDLACERFDLTDDEVRDIEAVAG
jgi:diketogulonate reductase-like aldo/keto reductase